MEMEVERWSGERFGLSRSGRNILITKKSTLKWELERRRVESESNVRCICFHSYDVCYSSGSHLFMSLVPFLSYVICLSVCLPF